MSSIPDSAQSAVDCPSSLYLRLSVTPDCNLKCLYCRPGGPGRTVGRAGAKPRQLDNERLLELVSRINDAVPVRKLRITGGEPLLRPGLVDLVMALHSLLPEADLCLTTNATLLEDKTLDLKRAGIRFLNISLDTLDSSVFRELSRSRGLSRVLAGIAAAERAGFDRLKLNTVLLRSRNADQVAEIVSLAARRGCEIRFVELMPFGEGARLFEKEFVSADEAFARIEKRFPCLGPLPASPTARRYRFDVEGRETVVGFIPAISHPFCQYCDRIRLDSFGRIFSCLRSEKGVNLDRYLNEGRSADVAAHVRAVAGKGTKQRTEWPRRSMVLLGG